LYNYDLPLGRSGQDVLQAWRVPTVNRWCLITPHYHFDGADYHEPRSQIPADITPDGTAKTFNLLVGEDLSLMDVLVHRPTIKDINPYAVAFQSMPGDEMAAVARKAPQLQVHEKVIPLGRADLATNSPEWPRYVDLLNYLASAMNWHLSEFDIYRLRVEYPVFGSVIRTQFHLE
jgi:hypothetical protein